MASNGEIAIISLPTEILENILSRLPYDQISLIRPVCKQFDNVGQLLLNSGFAKVDKYHAEIQKHIKSQLPRRESERRVHPLARHVDILSAIETRLSLLNMTFMKYLNSGLCCFIPGKVIDEIYRVLRYLKIAESPPHSHEILKELRDISSMAMEYFDEKIAPRLKKLMKDEQPKEYVANTEPRPGPSHSLLLSGYSTSPHVRMPSMRQDIYQLQHQIRSSSSSVISMKKELKDSRSRLTEQTKKLQEQEARITNQQRTISKQNSKIIGLERRVSEFNQKFIEYDQKFTDIMAEMDRIREVSPTSSHPEIDLVHSHVKSLDGINNINKSGKGKKLSRKRKTENSTNIGTPVAKRTRIRQLNN